MHLIPFAALLLASATSGNDVPRAAGAEHIRLKALSERFLSERAREDPIALVSEDATARRLRADRSLLAALSRIDRRGLTADDQVDAALLRNALRYELWRHDRLRDRTWDMQRYQELIRDALSDLPGAGASTAREELLGAAARFRQMPGFLARIRASVTVSHVPAAHALLAADQNGHALDGLLEPLKARAVDLTPVDREVFENSVRKLQAAFATHQHWLDHDVARGARGSFRLGSTLYDAKVRFELGSALSRPRIEADATAAIATMRRRMFVIARQALHNRRGKLEARGRPGPVQEEAAIRAALGLMEARHATRETFVPTIRTTLRTTTDFVRTANLVSVPDRTVDVVDMPADMQGIVPAFFQNMGERSVYAVSPIPTAWSDAATEDYLRSHNDYYLENLTIHEAMPGHYLQSTHLMNNASALRQALGSREFAEGWAVYAQQMMVDAGYLRYDPLFELAELQWRLGSACNAVLDIGVHTRGWTRRRGVAFLVRTCFQKPSEAASKWKRATLTSTQLLTYFVGYSELVALRDEVRRRRGHAFDLRAYNDELLSHGMPPVRLVRALMLGEAIR